MTYIAVLSYSILKIMKLLDNFMISSAYVESKRVGKIPTPLIKRDKCYRRYRTPGVTRPALIAAQRPGFMVALVRTSR